MEVQPIDYAPAPPAHRRRRFQQLLIGIALAIVVLPVGIRSVPLAWRHAELLYWQRQAMEYSPPPDQIVHESDPVEAAKLILSGGYLCGNGAISVAKPWDRFYRLLSPPGRVPKATVFLHALRNSRGESRLVAVEADSMNCLSSGADAGIAGDKAIRMYSTVFRPGSFFSTAQELPAPSKGFSYGPLKQVRSYAGQCDSWAPSHFTIRLVVDQQTHNVDGWLRDDDTIALEVRVQEENRFP